MGPRVSATSSSSRSKSRLLNSKVIVVQQSPTAADCGGDDHFKTKTTRKVLKSDEEVGIDNDNILSSDDIANDCTPIITIESVSNTVVTLFPETTQTPSSSTVAS